MPEFFTADQDIIDSLKIEMSVLTPEQDKLLEVFGMKIADFISLGENAGL